MDRYCQDIIEQENGFCERVHKRVPSSFCALACKGNWKQFRRKKIEKEIESHKVELTKEQETNSDLVSVIIPTVEGDRDFIIKTVDSIKSSATGPIEIIIFCDNWEPDEDMRKQLSDETIITSDTRWGLRKAMNHIANIAKGVYLVKSDAHVSISPEWDIRMKISCKYGTVVAPAIDQLDKETWTGKQIDMSLATLDGNLRMQYIHPWPRIELCPIEQEVICITGCFWMIHKEHYLWLGGCNESLGVWGALSPEWAFKTWLTGGRIVLRTDIVCSHLFKKRTPFTIDGFKYKNAFVEIAKNWITNKMPKQTRPAGWLVAKFAYMNNLDVPLFGFGGNGFAIRNKDSEFIKNFIKEKQVKSILEFGAGKSTLMFDSLDLKITSYETKPLIFQTVNALSSPNTEVVFYDGKTVKVESSYDMAFIDGPKSGEDRQSSYESVYNADVKFVACHDANRTYESKWINKYFSGWKCVASMPDGVIKIYERQNATI